MLSDPSSRGNHFGGGASHFMLKPPGSGPVRVQQSRSIPIKVADS
jgi:hypothetical protein